LLGVKFWKGQLFVTVPRWRMGVPSTLNKVITAQGQQILQPYPSWEMQTIGDPSALQSIQSMEIDSRGWMWILDVGRRNLLDAPNIVNGPPKLVIWDITNNCKIREFVFPNDVLPWNNSFANDLAVDETNGFAYISDTWAYGGVIVYSFSMNQARRFDHGTMHGNSTGVLHIDGKTYPSILPTDGIALSHDTLTVYYCAISTPYLYSVSATVLRDFSADNNKIGDTVISYGYKGVSDGMAMDNIGNLYFGNLEKNSVYAWNSKMPITTAAPYFQSDVAARWVDTFAYDQNGGLIVTSNKLHLFINGGMKFDGADGPNFRVLRIPITGGSYLTGNPQPPSLTCLQ